jgi:hypothetical protein
MRTSEVTAATATTGVVETVAANVTLSSNAKTIVGIGIMLASAGVTTLQSMSGIFRVSINNLDVTPSRWAFQGAAALGTDVSPQLPFKIYDVNWGPAGNSVVSFFVTMDTAQTINPTFRGIVIFDK